MAVELTERLPSVEPAGMGPIPRFPYPSSGGTVKVLHWPVKSHLRKNLLP